QQKVAQEVAPAQSATKTLEKEIAALNVKVQEADRISTEARYEHGNVPAGDLKALGQRLDELNRQLAVASADRARAGARLAEFKSAIAAKRLDSMPDVLASPLVQHLHEEEARRAAKVAEMSGVYGPGYPPLAQARAELADFQRRIDQEVSKIGATYASDFAVAQSKEAVLRRMVDQTQSDLAKASMSEVEVRVLDRAADARRSLMSQLVTRLNETQAEINRKGPEARVISRAALPRLPSFPPTAAVVASGALMAGT